MSNKAQRQIRAYSIQMNVQAFLKDLSALECHNLSLYLGGNFMTDAPNEIQKKFVNEFFGGAAWDKFIYNEKKDKQDQGAIFYRPSFDLEEIRAFVMYVTLQRIPDLLKEISKLKLKEATNKVKQATLKVNLLEAVHNSYFDGVFDKCDGWCNIADVLVEAKLLKLPKENDN